MDAPWTCRWHRKRAREQRGHRLSAAAAVGTRQGEVCRSHGFLHGRDVTDWEAPPAACPDAMAAAGGQRWPTHGRGTAPGHAGARKQFG